MGIFSGLKKGFEGYREKQQVRQQGRTIPFKSKITPEYKSRYETELKSSKDNRYKKQLIVAYRKQFKEEQKRKAKEFLQPIKAKVRPSFGESFATQAVAFRKRGLIYGRDLPRRIVGTGERKKGYRGPPGRPKGSYDPRYAEVGGVYNFRKLQAQKRYLERLQAMRNAQLSPRQQNLLAQQQQQDYAQSQNPEARTIPSTNGQVNMKSIQDEIDDAANILD